MHLLWHAPFSAIDPHSGDFDATLSYNHWSYDQTSEHAPDPITRVEHAQSASSDRSSVSLDIDKSSESVMTADQGRISGILGVVFMVKHNNRFHSPVIA